MTTGYATLTYDVSSNQFASIVIPGELGDAPLTMLFGGLGLQTEIVQPGTVFDFSGGASRIILKGNGLSAYSSTGFTFTQQGNANVTLSVDVGSDLAGDYNQDGVVDAADYTVWRDNFGTTNVLDNDPIGGVINIAQYDQWKANFGMQAGGGGSIASAGVPEPGSLLLVMSATVLFNLRRFRR